MSGLAVVTGADVGEMERGGQGGCRGQMSSGETGLVQVSPDKIPGTGITRRAWYRYRPTGIALVQVSPAWYRYRFIDKIYKGGVGLGGGGPVSEAEHTSPSRN